MPMKSWDDVADPLAFPVAGKTYVVPPISIRRREQLTKTMADPDAITGMSSEDLFRLATGDEFWDQLLADDVPHTAAWRIGMAALADVQQGRAAAEAVWETGLDPTRLAQFMKGKTTQVNRAARRAASKASRSTAADAASTASTSGTTSRKATKRSPAKGRKSTRGT